MSDFTLLGKQSGKIVFEYKGKHYKVEPKEILVHYSGRSDWKTKWDFNDLRVFIMEKGQSIEDSDEINLMEELPQMVEEGFFNAKT